MMAQRGVSCAAALAVLVASGCGPLPFAGPTGAIGAPAASLCDQEDDLAALVTPRPAADLSAAELTLPRFFAGVAIGTVMPESSSLQTSAVYDVNLAYDLAGWLSVEVLIGSWNVADRPSNVPPADSTLRMTPCLALVQVYRDSHRLRGRLYAGAGVGYSVNDYRLGSAHKEYVMDQDGLTDYDLIASDGPVVQAAVGWEAYSTADARLNLGLELRYVSADIDLTIRRSGLADYTIDFPADKLWMMRVNLTWHF